MKKKFVLLGALLWMLLAVLDRMSAAAAGTCSVHFGSDYYTPKVNSYFQVGFYLDGDGALGDYEVVLQFDPEVLQYVKGANLVENGTITLRGHIGKARRKYMLTFYYLEEKDTQIAVTDAYVCDLEGTPLTVTKTETAPVYCHEPEVAGGPSSPQGKDGLIQEESGPTVSEQETAPQAEEDGQEEGGETAETPVYQEEPPGMPELAVETGTGEVGQAVSTAPEISGDKTAGENPVAFGDVFSQLGHALGKDTGLLGACIAGTITSAAVVWYLVRQIRRKRSLKKTEPGEANQGEAEQKEAEDAPEDDLEMLDFDWTDGWEEKSEAPVISVQHVSMDFRISTSSASGIKEYIIQRVKREISFREFHALQDISFDVYKGEVVGIIGTNGSGKSTLLKIVSGALKPSGGCVIVDRKKVQILTLGSGFDMELTARENVYLNGAIIGYEQKFINEKYDEIVAFAELEGFMEEKMKNFSSGMVSRLGFAIATIGSTAEILILDEVLSVGDEFFRKKSLKRINEMIHSGSTVLIVSHSMGTILSNCTKVVWIEKGKMRMVGRPKAVCAEYQAQGA